jgi:hypothetical protein
MRTSTMLLWAVLALAANAFADGPAAQGGASTTSSTDVTANRNGASATNSSTSTASAGTKHAQAAAAGSSEMSATLSKPVDARKAKPGDPVTATNDRDAKTADGTSIKQGSKLLGHVTKAQPLDKSAAGNADASAGSMLALVFDKAVLKDGREVPLNATIQAISAAESDASLASEMGGAGSSTVGSSLGSPRASGGGLIGGVGGSVGGGLSAAGGMAGGVSHGLNGAVGGMANGTVHSAGAVGGLTSSGMLTSGSKGVFGVKGLDIVSSSAGNAEGSAITSSTRNVRLDGGTKMLLSNSPGGSMAASGAGQAAGSVSKSGAAKDSSSRTAAPAQTTHEPGDRN